jgi:hypothetical protein
MGLARWRYWQVWMHSWYDDPEGVVRGWYWRTPAGWGTENSPLYGPNHENGLGIVELEHDASSPFGGGGSTISSDVWWWNNPQPMGYHVYVQGFARLDVDR